MKDIISHFENAVAGKRILITGGTTGIGREIAILLASLGAKCLICGRHQEQIDETLNQLNQNGQSGSNGLVIDLSEEGDIQKLFQSADEQLGGLDVLVNNAALGYGSVLEGDYDDWKYIVSTNLLAYMACCKEAASRMMSDGGHIINIGSMSADVREENSSVYVATKAGIQGFSEAFRKEINPKGVKVTLIEPGAVDTDMQPGSAEEKAEQIENEEMLKAKDIAMAVLFCIAQPSRCDVVGMQIRPHLQLI